MFASVGCLSSRSGHCSMVHRSDEGGASCLARARESRPSGCSCVAVSFGPLASESPRCRSQHFGDSRCLQVRGFDGCSVEDELIGAETWLFSAPTLGKVNEAFDERGHCFELLLQASTTTQGPAVFQVWHRSRHGLGKALAPSVLISDSRKLVGVSSRISWNTSDPP